MARADRRTENAADEPIAREVRRPVAADMALKADPDARKLKRSTYEPTPDSRERADAARALKADAQGPRLKQEDAPAAEMLKERLVAQPAERDAMTLKRSAKTQAQRQIFAHGGPKPALRPVPDDWGQAAHLSRPRTHSVSCEIRHWRGYVTSQFYAVATDGDGMETTIRTSPSFRWLKADLPETPAAAAALRTLVDSLQEDGWRITGQHDEWFAVVMQRGVSGGAGAGDR